LRESSEREIAEHKRIIADLTADLATRARVQGETVSQFQREIAEHQTVIAALQTDLEAHRDQAAKLKHEIAELRQGLEQLGAELGARDELIALLRAELRHRWRSLKRALGPKRPTP
jgi:septal ring factor EnvC (AmiA/AmiB activator)